MHSSVMAWVGRKVAEHDLNNGRVLEVGSRDVNGSVRPLFGNADQYIGVDMLKGSGVDIIARADKMPFRDQDFDTVVTTEMLEHDPYFWLSIREMARVLRPGGMLLLTTRGIGFPRHDYPSDYWRFTPDAVTHLFYYAHLRPQEVIEDPLPGSPGVFGLASKVQSD